jgi:hypothetical protein
LSVDPLQERYPNISTYAYTANNPIKYIDPDGKKLRIANQETYEVLLSSLPARVRETIRMDKNNFIDAKSVNKAMQLDGNSGNLLALKAIVDDKRIVDLEANQTSYEFISAETDKTTTYTFEAPQRFNLYQELLNDYKGNAEAKRIYAETLKSQGILDEVEVNGNFGATLRPTQEQEPYPGGVISISNSLQVFVNPVGTTKEEKAKYVGHELFGHAYFYLIGKDPRHGGATKNGIEGNPTLENQINARETESLENAKKQ